MLSVLPLSVATFLDAVLLLTFCISLYAILGLNLYGLGPSPPLRAHPPTPPNPTPPGARTGPARRSGGGGRGRRQRPLFGCEVAAIYPQSAAVIISS